MFVPNILLVEDDAELRGLVAQRLEESGYSVELARTGQEALDHVENRLPDLVLLDIMIPEIDGLEVCRQLRSNYPLLYIIMLTAKTGEVDRVVGLEVGADDYVTKPFSLSELVARVRSALRRMRHTHDQIEHGEVSEDPIVIDHLSIDPVKRKVLVGEKDTQLTVLEFDLLLYLARNPDRPFTRLQLLDKIWDIQYEGYDRTVDSHVQRLRAKIEDDPGNPRYIRTVWGVGYKFQAESDN
ncbi:MAG: response regulator transcription factor [Rhodothermia bacterium]|nr:MAG: response regulator transcription factor [Rhodothermia bacterium]